MIDKDELRKDYENALEKMWDVDGWWAGNSVGETLCFLDDQAISLQELILLVEKEVSVDDYFEWSEYNSFALEFNQKFINLNSWLMGYRGLAKREQEHLRKLKQDLEDAMREYKEEF